MNRLLHHYNNEGKYIGSSSAMYKLDGEPILVDNSTLSPLPPVDMNEYSLYITKEGTWVPRRDSLDFLKKNSVLPLQEGELLVGSRLVKIPKPTPEYSFLVYDWKTDRWFYNHDKSKTEVVETLYRDLVADYRLILSADTVGMKFIHKGSVMTLDKEALTKLRSEYSGKMDKLEDGINLIYSSKNISELIENYKTVKDKLDGN